MSRTVRVGVLKAGCMGSLPLVEFLVDERADRSDIDVLVSGSGAKLGLKQCETARKLLVEAGVPTVVISDGPARKIVSRLEADGFGYIIIDADAMIGARREFLDPVEMALFNADMIKILAVTGVLRVITESLDDLIQAVKSGSGLQLPRLLVTKESAVASSGLINSYARAKAMAAYEIARHVAGVDSTACFKVPEWTRYVPLVTSGHEMIRAAAKLADDAREMDKVGDALVRRPHFPDGVLGFKTKLMEKPQRSEKEDSK